MGFFVVFLLSRPWTLNNQTRPDYIVCSSNEHTQMELSMHITNISEAKSSLSHHKDPFDRMLVAQAITERLILVTRDEKMSYYNVELLKA